LAQDLIQPYQNSSSGETHRESTPLLTPPKALGKLITALGLTLGSHSGRQNRREMTARINNRPRTNRNEPASPRRQPTLHSEEALRLADRSHVAPKIAAEDSNADTFSNCASIFTASNGKPAIRLRQSQARLVERRRTYIDVRCVVKWSHRLYGETSQDWTDLETVPRATIRPAPTTPSDAFAGRF
jgi:hypothetical protein